jgi:transcriptional regulator with XRE-family HTH domain
MPASGPERSAANGAQRSNLRAIGATIRRLRNERGTSLDQLASSAGISKGMLSKIENFRVIPTLPVLDRIAAALSTTLAALTEGVAAEPAARSYVLTKAGQGAPVTREDAVGFRYQALNSANLGGGWLETFLLELEPGSQRSLVTTEGHQCIHMLAGRADFVLDAEPVPLEPGDTLLFDGRVPHVPVNRGRDVARMLVIYLLDNDRGALG